MSDGAELLVVKIGGSLEMPDGLLADLAAHDGPLVVVHGAHRRLDELSQQLGHPARMVTSERGELSRFTDDVTMDHFLMAYAGLVNKRLVERFHALGRRTVGLTAMDGGIAVGRRRESIRIREGDRIKVLHGDHAGSIETIDPEPLRALLGIGLLPLLTPPAVSRDGVAINVDGDRLTMEVAIALAAARMMIFSDTPGFLLDPDDPGSMVARVTRSEADELMPSARGRARVKLTACLQALDRGVGAVGLVDGRGDHPLRDALGGAGTWFVP